MTAQFRQRIDTTYADLRPSDLVIDKSGQAWPLGEDFEDGGSVLRFWLLEPVTKIKAHFITRPKTDPVKVSRLPTQADEAAKLDADFLTDPDPRDFSQSTGIITGDNVYANAVVTLEEAVAAVEAIGGTVEAEVTAAEVDAAAAATDDAPLTLPAFATMTPLEARSHLYLLHGVYGSDLVSKVELGQLHDQAHATPPQSRYVPHVHA